MLAFAGCAFFPSTYISFKRRRNQPHPLARMGIKPGAPKPKWIRCQDDTGFELCRGAALVPRPPQPLGSCYGWLLRGMEGLQPSSLLHKYLAALPKPKTGATSPSPHPQQGHKVQEKVMQSWRPSQG